MNPNTQRFKARKWMSLLVVCSLAVSLATACQRQQDKVKSYSKDGMLGVSEVNPNMPLSPTYHHYEDDTNVIKEAIRQVPQVSSSNISLNGPVAAVTLTVPSGLTDQQAEAIRQDAYDKISKAVPRYKVKVAVKRK
ncbi:hypothetical protein [Paenibacillus rigui]|uniref:Sporulation protein n=1 Tax=Paenibacillus rigui TaxID=554312 RepID=A0A229UJU8_9BACL|nr:hypothetical protein [Paenibacillus rigui]OXM83169.1 hypothetical protein CF651_26920 [Paenibacillus rigui]